MNERIEANFIDRMLKFQRIISIALIIISVIRFGFKIEKSISGLGSYFDTIIMILIGGYFTFKSYTSEIKTALGSLLNGIMIVSNIGLKAIKN
jgi:hypothetical protein